ncbi:MAG: hypothetical protein J7J11_04650 [Desulfurococcales archaeon]|nr:hypothetical protein [Desulfurococcales archaeon]
MDDVVLYKNIESLTLKRDKLLRKLRKQVRDYGRGRIRFENLSPTLTELRKTRKAYLRVIEPPVKVQQKLKDSVITLMEFTYLVSVNDEEELLKRIIVLMRKNGVEQYLIEHVKNDLREVEELSKLVSEAITKLQS